jgi:hypothetical protein
MISVKDLISDDPKAYNPQGKFNSIMPITPYYELQGDDDKTLIFESRFESGNLAMAIKLSDKEYNLVL